MGTNNGTISPEAQKRNALMKSLGYDVTTVEGMAKYNALTLEERLALQAGKSISQQAQEKGNLKPDITDEAVQRQAGAMAARNLNGRGRAATFLTGPGGISDKKTLLGGF